MRQFLGIVLQRLSKIIFLENKIKQTKMLYKYFLNSYNNNNKRNRKARVSVERIFQDFSK